MREMNLQLQEVKKIMSSVNNNNKKNPQTHQDQNSENKEKGCQEKKTTTTYYIQMCLDWKKRSANIEFYTQTAILSKGINKRQLQTKTKTKKNKQTNKTSRRLITTTLMLQGTWNNRLLQTEGRQTLSKAWICTIEWRTQKVNM